MRHLNAESYDQLVQVLQKKIREGDQQAIDDADKLRRSMDTILDYYANRCTAKVRRIVRSEADNEQDTTKVIFATMQLDKLAKKYGLDPIYKIKSVNRQDIDAFCLELALSLYAAGL